MRGSISKVLGWLGFPAAFAYGYFVIGWPTSFEISRYTLQVEIFIVGFLVALLMRTLWSVFLVPAALIFSVVLAGIVQGNILTFREGLAGAFNTELWLFGATALGAFLGTILPRIVRLIRRKLREPYSPDAASLPAADQSSDPAGELLGATTGLEPSAPPSDVS